MWAAATAVVVLAASITIGTATGASAAPPEPLQVTVAAAVDTPQAGSVTVTYDVNQSARQITGVTVMVDGAEVPTTPLVAVTNKSSRGTVVLASLPTGEHDVQVDATNRKGVTASGVTSFVVSGGVDSGVNVDGARTWCQGVSGTFTVDDGSVGGYTENQTAFWSCLNANTVWELVLGETTPQPVIIEIMSNYCSTNPPNYSLVLSAWVNGLGDTTLDNFACWEDPTPIQ